jgi:membrane protein YqaA with SNARE-associated domain
MGVSPSSATASATPAPAKNPLRRLYHWILSWADHPWGAAILAVLAFLDSFIFPIPPLFLQVALSLERPRRSFWYAFVDTAASVVGSIIGYLIGYALYSSVGQWVIHTWHFEEQFSFAGQKFRENAFLFILAYSFVPFPYKVITIASGVFHEFVGLPTLLVASTVGRGVRFFGLGAICFFTGQRAKDFIEKYFNAVCLALGALVVAIVAYMALYMKPAGPPSDVRALEPRIEASTGWTFEQQPAFVTVDRKGFEAFMEAKLAGEEGRRLAAGGRAFQALGLLPKGYSIEAAVKKMYADEVLAVYDPKERRVLLVREALEKPGRSPAEREMTVAHEMVHALQHQHDPNFDVIESEEPDLDDVKGALHAVMEGEATVQQFAIGGTAVGPSFYQRTIAGLEANAAGKFATEPPVLRRMLYFPYLAGTAWMAARAPSEIRGTAPGLRAREPLSTEHLLHPERTLEGDPPLGVFVPDLSGSIGGNRRRTEEGVLGEKFLAVLLEKDAGPGGALDPALGWGGDRLQLYERADGTAPVAVLVTVWDTSSAALLAYARLLSREGLTVELSGKMVAVVAGLADPDARRIAREALGRSVAAPFRSVAELRAVRGTLVFPETARALADPLATADQAIQEAPGKDARRIPHASEILDLLGAPGVPEEARRLREVLKP